MKRVLLGITGSIAAYKAIQIVRDLTAAHVDVQVVVTCAACRFVSPLTLQVLSRKPVYTDIFESRADVLHVTLAQGVDLVAIAPVTADFIAKMATGQADDLLSAVLLSTPAPVLLAPAMDLGMWGHPAVLHNVAVLKERGCLFVDPESGPLASGLEGIGRMASPETILDRIHALLIKKASSEPAQEKPLAGEVVVVTAGPTREKIDPVRFISNRSSGKMGYAIAEVARQWGAEVILISGPTSLPPPESVKTVFVESAAAMKTEVTHYFTSATMLIMAAAVSDYTPSASSTAPTPTGGSPYAGSEQTAPVWRCGTTDVGASTAPSGRCGPGVAAATAVAGATQKLKRGPLVLELSPTDDILKGLPQKAGKFIVAFAAETENLYENAYAKLKEKGADLIVANDVTQEGAGFDGDTNIVTLIDATGHQTSLPKMPKRDVARHILQEVICLKGRKK